MSERVRNGLASSMHSDEQENGGRADFDEKLPRLADALSGGSRRARQNAAKELAGLFERDPHAFKPHIGALVDALNRPEAQTRWECLGMLTKLIGIDSRSCEKALWGAELALFDEESGTLRLAAMRFICRLGATTELRSKKTWPIIDEALQCFHGDFEYPEMLIALTGYSEGKIDAEVKQGLRNRMLFDAENGKGFVKRRSCQILENVS